MDEQSVNKKRDRSTGVFRIVDRIVNKYTEKRERERKKVKKRNRAQKYWYRFRRDQE